MALAKSLAVSGCVLVLNQHVSLTLWEIAALSFGLMILVG